MMKQPRIGICTVRLSTVAALTTGYTFDPSLAVVVVWFVFWQTSSKQQPRSKREHPTSPIERVPTGAGANCECGRLSKAESEVGRRVQQHKTG